jgi:hypothetical protein
MLLHDLKVQGRDPMSLETAVFARTPPATTGGARPRPARQPEERARGPPFSRRAAVPYPSRGGGHLVARSRPADGASTRDSAAVPAVPWCESIARVGRPNPSRHLRLPPAALPVRVHHTGGAVAAEGVGAERKALGPRHCQRWMMEEVRDPCTHRYSDLKDAAVLQQYSDTNNLPRRFRGIWTAADWRSAAAQPQRLSYDLRPAAAGPPPSVRSRPPPATRTDSEPPAVD